MPINNTPDVQPIHATSIIKFDDDGCAVIPYDAGATLKVHLLKPSDLANPKSQLLPKYEAYLVKDGESYVVDEIQGVARVQISCAFASISNLININFEITEDPNAEDIRIGLADFLKPGDIGRAMDWDGTSGVNVKTATDKLLIHGWTPSQTQLVRSGNHLFVRMGGSSTDQVALYNYFMADSTQDGAPANSKIDQIVFDNGDIWDQAKIDTVLAGGGSGGTGGGGTTPTAPPTTYTYAYVLADQYSDYTLTGNAPYVFKGNSKANKLTGNDGANVINGAAGNDTLTGGKGGDTYFLEAGTGQDTIVENDSTAGVNDLLQWGSNIRHDQIWLRKAGNNLEVSVIGTTNKAVVKDWYLGADRHVEQIWANGKMLSDTKVQALVDAMAAFSPPAAGQTTLSTSYQTALNPVIAANWN